jgi:hypothetical protein
LTHFVAFCTHKQAHKRLWMIHEADMAGFTKGPWHYRPHEYDDWGVVRADKFTICQARDWNAFDEETLAQHRKAGTDPWEANARLIAAAPELYEALKAIRTLNAKASESGYTDHTALNALYEANALASAALAKAEGRSE